MLFHHVDAEYLQVLLAFGLTLWQNLPPAGTVVGALS